jgi:outer membrane receptor for ferric coprogen and ferric-rhodotorulic acid
VPVRQLTRPVRTWPQLVEAAASRLASARTAPANAANANVILPPAIFRQKEIGIRDSYFKGLSISASWFDITRANAVTDPTTNISDKGNVTY